MRRAVVLGFVFTLVSAFFFAVAGPVAKTMYTIGWTPGSVVIARLGGAALVLLIPSLIALRGRWRMLRQHWRVVAVYGAVSMAGVQAFFFVAVDHLTVAVALLLEMTAPTLIVFWLWARTRYRPSTVTFFGVVVSMAGLVLVLDPGGARLNIVGVLTALAAAVCLASYFLVSADQRVPFPPIAFTGLGFAVGALVSVAVSLVGLLPVEVGFGDADFGGARVAWFVPVALIVLFTVGAYVCGIIGLRYIGATVGSFVNLAEVPFAALAAWIILAELPTPVQLIGGAVIVGGIVLIKWGDARQARAFPTWGGKRASRTGRPSKPRSPAAEV